MSSFGLLQKRCYAASTMMLILGTALEQTFKQTLTLPAISVGAPEIIIILVVVVLVFGTKRLPELGKGLGKSIKEFKSEMGQENSQENGPKSSSENSGQPLDSTEEGTGASTGNAQHTKSVNNAKVQQEHNA